MLNSAVPAESLRAPTPVAPVCTSAASPGVPAAQGLGAKLRVGGLTRMTSIDFPGRLAAVVFCQGCPWRCNYCHNPQLLPAGHATGLHWEQVVDFLRKRVGLLDGVVFSGGEPTLQSALPWALAEVRAMGFATALHTGGMYPQRLAAQLPLLDWVGLDIKAPWDRYDTVTATPGSAQPVQAALRHLLRSGVAYECRTTWSPRLFSTAALLTLAIDLASQGVTHWVLQQCRTEKDAGLTISRKQIAHMSALFTHFSVRTS